jgi:electron transfer flavoprotein alpha subunit
MKIAVLVKQVPVVSALRFDPVTRRLQRDGVPSEVSAFDIRALLRAVELKQADDEIVVLTMGPPEARATLLHCLALGADRGVHLVDRAFAGADTLATARALAAALGREPYGLVLCGRHSVDAETGQVGPEVAELLDVVQVTAANRVEIDREAGLVRAEREIDDGYESVTARLPVLVTAAEDLAAERFPSKAMREEAQRRPIVALSAEDLGLGVEHVGAAGSPTEVRGLETVESARQGRILDAGAIDATAALLVGELAARGFAPGRTAARDALPPAPDRVRPPEAPAYWVLAEVEAGSLRAASEELVGAASTLASGERGGHVAALLLGGRGVSRLGDRLAAVGADIVHVAEDPILEPYTTDAHAAVLAAAIREHAPAAVLIPATARGRDLAPRVAARLGLGLTGDCIDLACADDGRLVQYKPAFGGSVVAPIVSRTRPDMATVRPGMLRARRPNAARRAPLTRLEVRLPAGAPRLRVLGRRATGDADASALDTAAVVIGVGKGVGGPEGIAVVRTLAGALGAALGATRDVTDAGWLPRQVQIGLTGRAVAPPLYIAIGVRGAPEHLVGVRRAGLVVAINTNPKAPIFKHADLGVVGDYAAVVPAVVAALGAA